MDLNKTTKLIMNHEGCILFPYDDKTKERVRASTGKMTIGWGHNLDAGGISQKVADFILQEDINYIFNNISKYISFFPKLDDVRQAVLIDMAFQMGFRGLTGFKNTINCMANKNYTPASQEMMKSEWATEFPHRASTLSYMMYSGEWPKPYALL